MQYLYLIEANGHYKIGISTNVRTRMLTLETSNPDKIKIIACYGFYNACIVEQSLHQAFGHVRVRGEWFDLDMAQIRKIKETCVNLGGNLVDRRYYEPSPKNWYIENALMPSIISMLLLVIAILLTP